jgi:DNA-binding beta-propeller fold protein YncE
MHRSSAAVVVLLGCCAALAFSVKPNERPPLSEKLEPAQILPGVQLDGSIRLPNQWSLRPAGKQVALGDFPVNLAIHPNGAFLAALHAGYGEHEIIVVNLKTQRITCRNILNQAWYGLCFSPDGKRLYASGGENEVVHSFDFEDGLVGHRRDIRVADVEAKFIPAGFALDSTGHTLFVPGTWGDGVCIVSLDAPEKRFTIKLDKQSYPYACVPTADGKRLFVSLWSKAAVAVIDLEEKKVVATWPTEKHPTEMALSPEGKLLYVACSNSTKVSVLDTAAGTGLETINCALYPSAPSGNTPNSLSLTPDGQMLFVANADANNIAVFKTAVPGKSQPLGLIPTGWYPTSVRYNAADRKLYVANGKGTMSLANPQGPNPLLPSNKTTREYIAGLFRGTLSIINLPTPAKMAEYSKQAYACSPLRDDQGVTVERPEGNPIPSKPGDGSPIKYIIYIIKENRTYDQILGDVKDGIGDADLCIFPERITPNHHKLARQFVLLDNFYCDGEVSANGHEWSMGAYATDFIEKVWPLAYRRSELNKLSAYPSEGAFDAIARPAGGYLWDRCAEVGVSYRSYGEWIDNGKKPGDPGKARVKALEGHFDPLFRGFDLDYPDQKRADRFIEELSRFEKEGGMPQLSILRLPNDHTQGSRVGKPTPTAYVADNDLALGRVVEAVSKSKFWKETAIFVVEDDAQNGSDHIDAHRTVALVISPYTKRKHIDSSLYSTSSMLRTMELILGLKPMSQFDAAARPMYASFQAEPDERPYIHLVPETNLKDVNHARAWGATQSEAMDLTKEDAADDLLLNEIVWRSVRGPDSPMPAPVHAAFVFPHIKKAKDKDDDD